MCLNNNETHELLLTLAKQFLACTVTQSWWSKKLFEHHLVDKVKKV